MIKVDTYRHKLKPKKDTDCFPEKVKLKPNENVQNWLYFTSGSGSKYIKTGLRVY